MDLNTINKEIIQSLPKKKYIIESEISGVSNRRGNTYFDFKDDSNKLSGLIFRNKETIENGDKIKCSGRLSFYAPLGKLSFNVEEVISKSGLGDIYKDFLILKDNLEKKGYFNKEHKKHISGLIKKVIILSSSEGAAIQDIYRNMSNHGSKIKIDLHDVPVQGIKCPIEISNKLSQLNKYKNMIIILTRGGGDYQDLNGFNQEIIIDNIYKNNNIIISAIGHETDTVLSDLVADYSLPTPSLVAQFLIDHNNNLLSNWEDKIYKLENNINTIIQDKLEYLYQKEKELLIFENEIQKYINEIHNNILEEINTRIYKLDEYLNYLDSSGEITLYNNNMDTVKSLDDICHIFIDKKLHLKIKDKIYKIYDFKYKEI
jgi:exodeoxyribonuclease VII large subunit